MTATRRFGKDEPFSEWLRGIESLDSDQYGLTCNDADLIFHKFRHETKDLQLLMWVEVKCFNADIHVSQLETLWFHHQLLRKTTKLRCFFRQEATICHFGVYFLKLQSDKPIEGETMQWGRFNDVGGIQWKETTRVQSIINVLGFVSDPDNPLELLEQRVPKVVIPSCGVL